MGYTSAVVKPFRNLKAWLIGILLSLPIINIVGSFFIAGYSIQIASRVMNNNSEVVDWHKAGNKLLVDGIKVWIINLVYCLPGIVLFSLGNLLIVISILLTAINIWSLEGITTGINESLFLIIEGFNYFIITLQEQGSSFIIESFNSLMNNIIAFGITIPELLNAAIEYINSSDNWPLFVLSTILIIIGLALIVLGRIIGFSAILNFAKTGNWGDAFDLKNVIVKVLNLRFLLNLIVSMLYVSIVFSVTSFLFPLLVPAFVFPVAVTVYTIMAEAYS